MNKFFNYLAPDYFQLIAELHRNGAERLLHGEHRTLFDHLMGTFKILRQWNQSEILCKAGLFHSCYSTYAYRQELFNIQQREKIQALIGVEAEEIVYSFCTIDRKALTSRLIKLEALPEDGLEMRNLRTLKRDLLSKEIIANLVILEMANLADQANIMGKPSTWLSWLSSLATIVRPHIDVIPPILNSLTFRLFSKDEQLSWLDYNKGINSLSSNLNEARKYFENSILANPCVGEPRLLLSLVAFLQQNADVGIIQSRTGLRLCQELATAWDKRRSWNHWLALGEWLKYLGAEAKRNPDQINKWLSSRFSQISMEPFRFIGIKLPVFSKISIDKSNNNVSVIHKSIPSIKSESNTKNPLTGWARFETYLKTFLENENNPSMMKYPGLSSKPFHIAKLFKATAVLETAYPQIKKEFLNIRGQQGFQPEMEPIKRTGAWNIFMLYERGIKNKKNCEKCPETTRIIERISSVRTHIGLIYFSTMIPGTHIAAHTGPTNMRLRCHLGLVIPDKCGIRVDTQIGEWKEGKCLIFDDSFNHEVWNNSEKSRSVLIVDLWHPDLTSVELQAIQGLHRHVQYSVSSTQKYLSMNERGRTIPLDDMHWL